MLEQFYRTSCDCSPTPQGRVSDCVLDSWPRNIIATASSLPIMELITSFPNCLPLTSSAFISNSSISCLPSSRIWSHVWLLCLMLSPIPSTKIVSSHRVECQHATCSSLSIPFIILILLTSKQDMFHLIATCSSQSRFPSQYTPRDTVTVYVILHQAYFIEQRLLCIIFAAKSFFLKEILCRIPLYTRDNHETSLTEDGQRGAKSPWSVLSFWGSLFGTQRLIEAVWKQKYTEHSQSLWKDIRVFFTKSF